MRNSNPGHIGGRQVLSPLSQPCHHMVNDCSKLKMFSPESEIFLSIKPKKKKTRKFGSTPTFRSTRKGKKCFLWWPYVCLITLRCYTTSHLHQVFFDFAQIFSLVFRTSKLLEIKEFNKTIIPFALVGYENGYSQLGATRLVGYLPYHIQRALME